MNLTMQTRGRVVFVGWEEPNPDLGTPRQFIVKVALDQEAVPNWPWGVVWGQVPVTMTLDDTRKETA